MNRIDQAIRDAEGAVDKVTSTTHTHAIGVDEHKECQACHDQAEAAMMPTTKALEGLQRSVDAACAEIDKLREDKQTCVLMLRALYAWLDGIGDGMPDASAEMLAALEGSVGLISDHVHITGSEVSKHWLEVVRTAIQKGRGGASALQKEALWRCATITEVLEKVGEL